MMHFEALIMLICDVISLWLCS